MKVEHRGHLLDEERGTGRKGLDYEPPAVTSLGSVAEITQGTGLGGTDTGTLST